MAAHRKRPIPPARMVELLMDAKRELLAGARRDGVDVSVVLTRRAFDEAWTEAWEAMVAERAWPHATEHRRQWRAAMLATRSECMAAFLARPTTFSLLVESLTAASTRFNLTLSPEMVPDVVIGAIRAGYSATGADEAEDGEVREEALA